MAPDPVDTALYDGLRLQNCTKTLLGSLQGQTKTVAHYLVRSSRRSGVRFSRQAQGALHQGEFSTLRVTAGGSVTFGLVRSHERFLNLLRDGVGGSEEAELKRLPSVLDAWGTPIMYARRIRSNGPLVGNAGQGNDDLDGAQFSFGVHRPLLYSEELGLLQQNQTYNTSTGSILGETGVNQPTTLAQIIRTPAIGQPKLPQSGAPRGEYVVISSGPDGVFFAVNDGPGNETIQVRNIVDSGEYATPTVVTEYDDIIISGGG